MSYSNMIKARHTFMQAVRPTAERAASTVNGVAINRGATTAEIADDLLFVFETGATSGTPDSFTVTAKVEHSSDDGSTDAYAQVTDLNIVEAATKVISAVNTVESLAVRAVGLKQYVRLVLTIAFVNGTTPKVYTNAFAILGKRRND